MLTLDDRHRLVTENLKFVVSIAARYRDRGLTMDDLVAEGNLGLVEAARLFDPARGVRFTTYAVYWIRRGMLRALAQHHLALHIPEGRRRLLASLREQERLLAAGPGAARADEEVARRMRITRRELEVLKGAGRMPLSLSAPESAGSERTLGDSLAAPEAHDPERAYERDDARVRLHCALGELDARERTVIGRRFGLADGSGRSLRTVGALLGVSGEAVRGIEKRALRRLKSAVDRCRRRHGAAPQCPRALPRARSISIDVPA